jgi:hypothetical protein
MVEIYLDESAKRTPKKVRGSKDPEQEMRGRSDAGKRISGDEKTGPRYYTLGRRVSSDAPTQPGEKPANTPKLSQSEKDEIQYRKANLKAGKTHTIGGKKGLPESYDMFDVILEYLVAEGYADTNESALVIMANMSEEWRESIMEMPYQIYGPDPTKSSDSPKIPLGKPYKSKKRAKTRADKLDLDIGGYRHSVHKTPN